MKCPPALSPELFKPNDSRLMLGHTNGPVRGLPLLAMKGGILVKGKHPLGGNVGVTFMASAMICDTEETEESSSVSSDSGGKIVIDEERGVTGYEDEHESEGKYGNNALNTSAYAEADYECVEYFSGNYHPLDASMLQGLIPYLSENGPGINELIAPRPESFKTCTKTDWASVGRRYPPSAWYLSATDISSTHIEIDYDSGARVGTHDPHLFVTYERRVTRTMSGMLLFTHGRIGAAPTMYLRGKATSGYTTPSKGRVTIYKASSDYKDFLTLDDDANGKMPSWEKVAEAEIDTSANNGEVVIPFPFAQTVVHLVTLEAIPEAFDESDIPEVHPSWDPSLPDPFPYIEDDGTMRGEWNPVYYAGQRSRLMLDDIWVSNAPDNTVEEFLEQPW